MKNHVLSEMRQAAIPASQCQAEADFLVGGKSAGGQQHRCRWKRNPELLHQNPAE